MIIFSASSLDKENYNVFSRISEIIASNMTPQMSKRWTQYGYEGLFDLVPPHFGMKRMYRIDNNYVTFEFTPEQWTLFVLKWL